MSPVVQAAVWGAVASGVIGAGSQAKQGHDSRKSAAKVAQARDNAARRQEAMDVALQERKDKRDANIATSDETARRNQIKLKSYKEGSLQNQQLRNKGIRSVASTFANQQSNVLSEGSTT